MRKGSVDFLGRSRIYLYTFFIANLQHPHVVLIQQLQLPSSNTKLLLMNFVYKNITVGKNVICFIKSAHTVNLIRFHFPYS